MNQLDLPPNEPTTAEDLRARTRRVRALRREMRRPQPIMKEPEPEPAPPPPAPRPRSMILSKHAPIVKERPPAILDDVGRPFTNIKTIIMAVSDYFNIPVQDILSDRRFGPMVRARQVGMYLAKKLTRNSLPEIGRRFHRDHTTVLCAIHRVEMRMEIGDERIKEAVAEIERLLLAEAA